MFCQECGAKNDNGAVFCGECGTKLINPVETANVQPQQQAQQVQPTPQETQSASVGMQTAPVVERRKMPTLLWVLLIEIVVLIVAIIGLCRVASNAFSAETVAERYFVSLVNGNYTSAYNQMGLEESEFTTADSFASYCASLNLDKVTNYNISEQSSSSDYYSSLFESDSSSTDTSIGTTMVVNYRNTGDENDYTYYVYLTKSSQKKFLFFDIWEVVESSAVASDYYIVVPEGSSVTFDGMDVSEAYIVTDENNSFYSYYGSDGCTIYCLPQVFQGEHQIVVTQGEYAVATETISISYDEDYCYISSLGYTTEAINELQNLAVQNLQTIYEAAASGADYSTISGLFSSDSYVQSDAECYYNYLVEYFQDEDLVSLNINSVTANTSADSAYIYLTIDYTAKYQYSWWWYEDEEVQSYDGSDETYVTFTYEDGAWVQTIFANDRLYY